MARIALLASLLLALAAPAASEAAGPARTKKILRTEMAKAGAYSGAYVTDLETGRALYSEDASVPRIPASVEKLYTSATALERFGPTGVLATSALGSVAPDDVGVLRGNLYLRGGAAPS